MPYDENFYRLYREYLQEPVVRQNHDRVFALLASLILPEKPKVLDLGCGVGEYPTFDSQHVAYVGVDRNNPNARAHVIQADYTTLDFRARVPFAPNAFLSLFSIECCQPARARYVLYEQLFAAFPEIRCGLVGGFFYESQRAHETVAEAGEIVSYQTIEDPTYYISDIFIELRLCMRTPSSMFGHDVVEVWKFLMRK